MRSRKCDASSKFRRVLSAAQIDRSRNTHQSTHNRCAVVRACTRVCVCVANFGCVRPIGKHFIDSRRIEPHDTVDEIWRHLRSVRYRSMARCAAAVCALSDVGGKPWCATETGNQHAAWPGGGCAVESHARCAVEWISLSSTYGRLRRSWHAYVASRSEYCLWSLVASSASLRAVYTLWIRTIL